MPYPIKSIGLLWDAKSVTPGSQFVDNPANPMQGNSQFGPNCANAIYVGGSGRVDVVLADGKTILTFLAMTAGIWMGMPPFLHINAGAASPATGIIVGITAG